MAITIQDLIASDTISQAVDKINFNFENLKVLIELNHKGDFILDKIANNEQYWPGQLIHSKHTEATKLLKPGLKLSVTNKIKF